MSNLTQNERDGLNELFCRMRLDAMPLHKRLLLKLHAWLIAVKLKYPQQRASKMV